MGMKVETYVNETDTGWVLTFGSPYLPKYTGPVVKISDVQAALILKR